MKKVGYLAIFLLLTACQAELKTNLDRPVNREQTFYATIEGAEDSQTKVYADSKLKVLWNAGDCITIFNKYTHPDQYRFTGKDGDNAGQFALVEEGAGGFVVGNELDCIYAVYPYNQGVSITNEGVLTVPFPQEQTYRANSFGPGANTMVSVGTSGALRFKNAGGYVSLKLFGNNVSVASIELQGNNHEKIAGDAQVTMAKGGNPEVAFGESALETVSLICPEPVVLGTTAETATEFWLVLPPVNFTKGFTVTVLAKDGGKFSKSMSSGIEIVRNTLAHMAALEVVPSTPEALAAHVQDIPRAVFEYDNFGQYSNNARDYDQKSKFVITWEDMNSKVLNMVPTRLHTTPGISFDEFKSYYNNECVLEYPTADSGKSYIPWKTVPNHEGVDEPNGLDYIKTWESGSTKTEVAGILFNKNFDIENGETWEDKAIIRLRSKDRYVCPDILITFNFAVVHNHNWPQVNPDYFLGVDEATGMDIVQVKGRVSDSGGLKQVVFESELREHFRDYLRGTEGYWDQPVNHSGMLFALEDWNKVDQNRLGTIRWTDNTPSHATCQNQTILISLADGDAILMGDYRDVVVTLTDAMENDSFYYWDAKAKRAKLKTNEDGSNYIPLCKKTYIVRFKNIFKIVVSDAEILDTIEPSTVDLKDKLVIKDDAGTILWEKGEINLEKSIKYGLYENDFKISFHLIAPNFEPGTLTIVETGGEAGVVTWQNLGTLLVNKKVATWFPAVILDNFVGFNVEYDEDGDLVPAKEPTQKGTLTVKPQ